MIAIPSKGASMNFISRTRLLLLSASLCSATVLAATPSTEIPPAIAKVAQAQITPQTLRAPIRFLAADELEGRGPATRGDALARLYLSAELESLGYQPGGEKGGWEQTVDVVGVTAKLPSTWDFTGKGGGISLKWSEDYIAGSGVQQPSGEI